VRRGKENTVSDDRKERRCGEKGWVIIYSKHQMREEDLKRKGKRERASAHVIPGIIRGNRELTILRHFVAPLRTLKGTDLVRFK
jgi:hypothetical protein